MKTYVLSERTLALAEDIGGRRHLGGLKREQKHGIPPEQALRFDIEGAAAEMVAAKRIGVEYEAAVGRTDRDGDIGPGIQVRHTRREAGCLILHPEDDDMHTFILVRGELPRLTVAGWIMGGDGKIEEFWREDVRSPAFFVPVAALHSL